ncbi:MAG: RidA family protein [Rhodothermia bacterium]|nr:RidA family protein [Rhodothermia bacterium]
MRNWLFLVLCSLSACSVPPSGVRKIIATDQAPKAIGPYSQAVKVGDMVWLAGQLGLTPGGQLVEGGIEAETKQAMENTMAVLRAAGMNLAHVVQVNVFLTDLADFQKFNSVYGTYFPTDPPARSTVQVAALPRNARVQIAVTAIIHVHKK